MAYYGATFTFVSKDLKTRILWLYSDVRAK